MEAIAATCLNDFADPLPWAQWCRAVANAALNYSAADLDELLKGCYAERKAQTNPCPVSYPHPPHDYCDGKPRAYALFTHKRPEERAR